MILSMIMELKLNSCKRVHPIKKGILLKKESQEARKLEQPNKKI